MKYSLLFISLLIFSCTNKSSNPLADTTNIKTKSDTSIEITQPTRVTQQSSDSSDYQTTPFLLVKNYPTIKDTAYFIRELKNNFHISEFKQRRGETQLEVINIFKKIKLYGSKKEYYLIEYDYHDGSMASFPWKIQFIFDSSGTLVKSFQALRTDLVTIFTNQNPFFLVTIVSGKGNGGHEIYKFSGDSLENVYEGYYDYETQTYDVHGDRWVYEPNELNLSIKDFNRDGYNDISFSGKLVLLEGYKNNTWYNCEGANCFSIDHPFKKLTIRYAFLYDSTTGHFVESDKYSIKNPYADL